MKSKSSPSLKHPPRPHGGWGTSNSWAWKGHREGPAPGRLRDLSILDVHAQAWDRTDDQGTGSAEEVVAV
jgi:hypothetical protein